MHTYIGHVDDDIDCVVKGNTMPIVVGIRFKDSGKTYYFDPTQTDAVVQGQYVIVETARGLELARVSELPHEVEESAIVGELKPVIRHATPEDTHHRIAPPLYVQPHAPRPPTPQYAHPQPH